MGRSDRPCSELTGGSHIPATARALPQQQPQQAEMRCAMCRSWRCCGRCGGRRLVCAPRVRATMTQREPLAMVREKMSKSTSSPLLVVCGGAEGTGCGSREGEDRGGQSKSRRATRAASQKDSGRTGKRVGGWVGGCVGTRTSISSRIMRTAPPALPVAGTASTSSISCSCSASASSAATSPSPATLGGDAPPLPLPSPWAAFFPFPPLGCFGFASALALPGLGGEAASGGGRVTTR